MNDPEQQQLPQPERPSLPPVAGFPDPDVAPSAATSPVLNPESALWKYILAGVGFLVLYFAMLLIGGKAREFAIIGLEAIPFVILAMLAYAGLPAANDWARGLTFAYWVLMVGVLCMFALVATFIALRVPVAATGESLPAFAVGLRMIGAFLAVVLSVCAAAAFFLPAVRRKAAEFLGLDPHSFVHATALATTVAIALIFVIPLVFVREPPLLSIIRTGNLPTLLDADETLRGTMYMLIWSIPASFLAVGYPQKRAFREARERLGLLWPGWLQLAGAVVAIGVLIAVVTFLESGITWLWNQLGWAQTDAEAVGALFKFGAGPVAAAIVGLSAGVSEELVYRGVLQPRLGIVLPALMFTSVHAFQYNFDGLILVLLMGITFGLIRKWTNTTTCVLIHAGYDFVLLFHMYLENGAGQS